MRISNFLITRGEYRDSKKLYNFGKQLEFSFSLPVIYIYELIKMKIEESCGRRRSCRTTEMLMNRRDSKHDGYGNKKGEGDKERNTREWQGLQGRPNL